MIFERVAKVLADYNHCAVEEIQRETTFADLGLDSLDMVDLIMGFEEEFGLPIEIEERLETVGDLVALIEGLEAERK